MERKRLDYWNLVKQYYDTERDETHQDTYRQVSSFHQIRYDLNPLSVTYVQI